MGDFPAARSKKIVENTAGQGSKFPIVYPRYFCYNDKKMI